MSSQRLVVWTIVLVAVIAALAYRLSVFRAPPEAPTPRIAFVTGGSGPYWQLTVSGAKAAAREHDAELRIEMPSKEESLEEQMTILTHLDLDSLDGIALSPLDAEGQTHLINKLARAKNVVTFDSDAPLSDRQSHVGTSNFSAGRACARLVDEALSEGGKVAVLLANLTKENLIDRKGGFQERLSQFTKEDADKKQTPKFLVVGYLEDGGDDQKCVETINDTLNEHPDLACFVGMNARHGPVLLKTLDELGKLGQIKLITFDADAETLDGIDSGHIFATIAQDPYNYGYEAVKILTTLCRGHGVEIPIVGKGSVYVGAEAIRQDNLSSFRKSLRLREGAAEQHAESRKRNDQ